MIEPRIHLNQAAILSRKPGPPLFDLQYFVYYTIGIGFGFGGGTGTFGFKTTSDDFIMTFSTKCICCDEEEEEEDKKFALGFYETKRKPMMLPVDARERIKVVAANVIAFTALGAGVLTSFAHVHSPLAEGFLGLTGSLTLISAAIILRRFLKIRGVLKQKYKLKM